MKEPVSNLRIHFYGVQGSGSTFPTGQELASYHLLKDLAILQEVFQDLQRRTDDAGHIPCRLDEILGGPLSRETLAAYRDRLDLPAPRVYGGLTTCVWVETGDGHDIVLDCGSGFRHCAKDLQSKWGERDARVLNIFGSHSHYDHTEGFDQAAVCFDPRNTIRLHGNGQFLRALDGYLGIFSNHVPEEQRRIQTPLTFREMPATFEGVELRSPTVPADDAPLPWQVRDLSQPHDVGATRITTMELYHSAPCLGFKVEHGGHSFLFCTDHELRHGPDPDDPRQRRSLAAEEELRQHAREVDLMYRDGQFLRSEYDGVVGIDRSAAVPRMDWGHSCIEDVQSMARECEVKRSLVGHHDPNRKWAERNEVDNSLERFAEEQGIRIELARANVVIDL